jgi:hypothetical protein
MGNGARHVVGWLRPNGGRIGIAGIVRHRQTAGQSFAKSK